MITTGSPVISIYTEMTPNPETMKFVANKLLYPGKSIDFPDVESAKPSPLAMELFAFPFVKAVLSPVISLPSPAHRKQIGRMSNLPSASS